MRGQAAHPDAEILAEFRAGLVRGMRGRRVAAHLAGCSRCAGVTADLDAVSAALRAMPAATLPDPVAARIGTALAAEMSGRAAAERPERAAARAPGAGTGRRADAPGPRWHVSPHGPQRGPRRGRGPWPVRPAILVPAAACLLLAAGGGYLLSQQGSPAAPPPTAARAAGPQAGTLGPRAGAPVQPGPDHISPSTAVNAGDGAAGVIVLRSGTDYRQSSLRAQVERELARVPRADAAATRALSDCVLEVAGGASPVFVDEASYQARPADVIFTSREAWVVRPRCGPSHRDLVTSVTLRAASAGSGISTP